MCNTAVFLGEELAKYGFGESHPFNSGRMYAFESKFYKMNLDKFKQVKVIKPTIAKEEDSSHNFMIKTT